MVNKIIELVHGNLIEKCYVDWYGGVTYAGKQLIGGIHKRMPIACWAFNADGSQCTPGEGMENIMAPDDSKKSVISWNQVGQINVSKVPGLARNRNIKKCEVLVDLVVWLNLNKFVNPNDSRCLKADQLTLETVKALNCPHIFQNLNFSDDGLANVRMEVVKIGDINSYRAVMSKYNIEGIEAMTLKPFHAFTITVKFTFLFSPNCSFLTIACSNEGCEFEVIAVSSLSDICEGGTAVFSITSEVLPGDTFQWQRLNEGTTWVNIPGETSETYEPGVIVSTPPFPDQFRVMITRGDATMTSNIVNVNVLSIVPEITSEQDTITVEEVTTLNCTIFEIGHSYLWENYYDGVWYEMGTQSALLVEGEAVSPGEYRYRVTVTNDELGCMGTSEEFIVAVTPA